MNDRPTNRPIVALDRNLTRTANAILVTVLDQIVAWDYMRHMLAV